MEKWSECHKNKGSRRDLAGEMPLLRQVSRLPCAGVAILEPYPWPGLRLHRAIGRLAVLDSDVAESGPDRFTGRPASSYKELPGLFALRPCFPGTVFAVVPAAHHVSRATGRLFGETRRLPGGGLTQRGAGIR